MKRLCVALLMAMLWVADASALTVAGVRIEPTVGVNNQTLTLNGSGIRKKFFVKVYVGSLYTARHVTTGDEALNDPGDKLIRMNFLHSRVEKGKITEAFREGFASNSPAVAGSNEAKRFLDLFTADFLKGDVVDIMLRGDGTVTAKQNGRVLGTVASPRLARAILAIYLGEKPADEGLKKGMLGGTY